MGFFRFRGSRRALACLLISAIGVSFGFFGTKVVFGATKSRFEKLELFNKVLFLIESQYYRNVDTEKLVQGALKGMMDTLDPHSAFLDKSLYTKMKEDTQGEFGGLGIEVTQKDGVVIIVTPVDDGPAYKAGLKPGDKIVEIKGESIIGMSLEKVVDRMKGEANTKITIGVIRKGVDGTTPYTITRKIIRSRPVKSALIDKNYIFIRLTQFQKKSASEIIKAIRTNRKKAKKHGGAKGIVLDLRSNPGGLLDEAVGVSSIFMKGGIVVSTEGRNKKDKEIRYVKKTGHKELDIPMVVLINGSSASASEIVAGALQDSKRAIVMGTQSFGKGSVQSVSPIDSEKGVKLTIAQYMTPSGKKIQTIGIVPDVEINEMDAEWISEHRISSSTIREIDLRNHLTATIETKDERKLRKKRERKERKARIKAIKNRQKEERLKKTRKSKKDPIFKKYNPAKDYQVIQAVNHLKSFGVFKKMIR